jgi:hypothetical protein
MKPQCLDDGFMALKYRDFAASVNHKRPIAMILIMARCVEFNEMI